MRDRESTEGFRFSKVWVIAGIAITVGIVGFFVTGVRGVKEGSKIKRAENEIRALVSAINSYESHYGAPPVSDLAKHSVTPLCPDLTFGTVNQQVNDHVSAGIGSDGVYRDPWGNPYVITLDMNGDGRCRDALYRIQTVSSLRGGATGHHKLRNHVDGGGFSSDFEAEVAIMVWSFGPDGKVDNNPADRPPNKDNIFSWE